MHQLSLTYLLGMEQVSCERFATSASNPLTMQFVLFLLLWGAAPRRPTEKQVQGHRLKTEAAGV